MGKENEGFREISVDEFVRAVQVNSASPHALFLGAGASISSGVPSAASCIWDWKRQLFVTRNPGLGEFLKEVSSLSVRSRIQRWLDEESCYPPAGAPEEYEIYAEKCFPLPEDRRRYFQRLIEQARPHAGYQLAALLAEAGLIRSVWTTNFDSLLPRAAAACQTTVIEIGLDTASRAYRQPTDGELIHVALHGDFRYDSLKNTTDELREQDQHLRASLEQVVQTTNLIVLGYSGRDTSVIDTLCSAYSQPGAGRLYWCALEDAEVPSAVHQIGRRAAGAGRYAFHVRIKGFDDTVARLTEVCLSDDLRSRAREIWVGFGESATPADFVLPSGEITSVVKSNAFPLTPPVDLLELSISDGQGEGLWQRMREQLKGLSIVAAVSRGSFLAYADAKNLKGGLGKLASGAVHRTPLQAVELERPEVAGLLAEAITLALGAAYDLPVEPRQGLVWRKLHEQLVRAAGSEWPVHKGASLAVRRYSSQTFLVLEPTVVAVNADGKIAAAEVQREVRQQLLVRQYNKQFNEEVNAWRNLLFPEQPTLLRFPSDADSPFEFKIDRRPTFAGIREPKLQRHSMAVSAEVRDLVGQEGVVREEPSLLFSSRDGRVAISDTHPMRGLAGNRPYDFRLTAVEKEPLIRVAVISPRDLARPLANFLNQLNQRIQPDSKREYLVPYPSFATAFGLALDLPAPTDDRWATITDPKSSDPVRAARELASGLIGAVERLAGATNFDVLFIGIPSRWWAIGRFETEEESFDLHDFIKAHCVQRGIATQFLREETFSKTHQCEIRWWLALAIYVKSMRTPWILADQNEQTAFLGLGFSVKPKRDSRGHIISGCSHIYNAEGVGLRYRLSRMENSFLRGRNPYMSYQDARRLAESARQLLTERGSTLPQRVVIHRRTPYREEEMKGLREGLAGVSELELLEITIEPRLRYVASTFKSGVIKGDTFPVARGTIVLLDESRFLLWAHGSVPALEPGRRYFKGHSRIPAPLLITRYSGRSSLLTIAGELLGLSKMNWNTFDMYSHVPSTIESSREIARIGSLLQRFGASSYDYRLFI